MAFAQVLEKKKLKKNVQAKYKTKPRQHMKRDRRVLWVQRSWGQGSDLEDGTSRKTEKRGNEKLAPKETYCACVRKGKQQRCCAGEANKSSTVTSRILQED